MMSWLSWYKMLQKVDAARYTIKLCSLVSTNIGVAQPIIENDNEVSSMMYNVILM